MLATMGAQGKPMNPEMNRKAMAVCCPAIICVLTPSFQDCFWRAASVAAFVAVADIQMQYFATIGVSEDEMKMKKEP
jgi:hypothetical protein